MTVTTRKGIAMWAFRTLVFLAIMLCPSLLWAQQRSSLNLDVIFQEIKQTMKRDGTISRSALEKSKTPAQYRAFTNFILTNGKVQLTIPQWTGFVFRIRPLAANDQPVNLPLIYQGNSLKVKGQRAYMEVKIDQRSAQVLKGPSIPKYTASFGLPPGILSVQIIIEREGQPSFSWIVK